MANSNGDVKFTPPTWMNKHLVENILRAEDEDPSLIVSSCKIVSANITGDGYTSDMFRVIVTLYSSEERRLIFKCHPQGGLREEAIKTLNAFPTESRMLRETLPKLQKILDQARPGDFNSISPRCLYYGKEPTEYLVLEDLGQSGFRNAERQQGLDLNHCILVFKTLARLHASSVALLHEDADYIEHHKNSVYLEETKQVLAPFYENTLRSLVTTVSKWPGYEHYVPKINKHMNTVFDYLIQIYKPRSDRLNVLVHGDCWTNNIMFRYSGDTPDDIRAIDFQLSNFSSPVIDLQYFLHTSPSLEVRLNCLDLLLEQYHKTFTDVLDILGCSKYSISLEELKKTFKEHYTYGFITAAAVLPIVLSDPEEALDLEEAMAKDVNTSGQNSRMYSNERYLTAMKHLLPLFEQEGVFK